MDLFKRIEFKFENIKDLCKELNIDKYIFLHREDERRKNNSRDIDSYVFCLKKLKYGLKKVNTDF